MTLTKVALSNGQSGTVSATITTANQACAVAVNGYADVTFYFAASTHATATINFEVSPDSTDGANGTWYPALASKQDTAAAPSSSASLATDVAAVYSIGAPAPMWVRARVSVIASGTLPIMGIASTAARSLTGTSTTAIIGTLTVQGSLAEDAASASGANGFAIMGVRAPATPTTPTSAAGDYGMIQIDTEGKFVPTGYGDSAQTVQTHTALTATADTSLVVSAGAGLRNYLTDLVIENVGGSASQFILKDGSTVLTKITVPAGDTKVVSLHTPFRGSAATAINGALGAAGTVNVSVIGYKGV